MTQQISPAQPLNEVQVMLLRLFSRPMPEHDIEAIRNLLLDYYENALHSELERVIAEKGISDADFEQILNQQQRTK